MDEEVWQELRDIHDDMVQGCISTNETGAYVNEDAYRIMRPHIARLHDVIDRDAESET